MFTPTMTHRLVLSADCVNQYTMQQAILPPLTEISALMQPSETPEGVGYWFVAMIGGVVTPFTATVLVYTEI